ncbi:hypothetical protein J4450_02420 [Candidatus Micrarchaeota archaeon]|nr:hypothetical protein [Candidatus Micrarchaeota archaeon]
MGPKTKTSEAKDVEAAVDLLVSFAKTNDPEQKRQFIEILNEKGRSKEFQQEFIKMTKNDPIIGPLINALIELNKVKNQKAETDPNQLLAAIEDCNSFFGRLSLPAQSDVAKEVSSLIEKYGTDFIVLMHKNREEAKIASPNERVFVMSTRELSLPYLLLDIEQTRVMLDELEKAVKE